MKKIPTLFERVFENRRIVGITDKVYPGMEWVLEGKGIATEKIDGPCTVIIDGVFYKRYDTKILDVPRTFDGIKQYLAEHRIDGIVFWLDGEPMCKIKRSDFGFDW